MAKFVKILEQEKPSTASWDFTDLLLSSPNGCLSFQQVMKAWRTCFISLMKHEYDEIKSKVSKF